LDGLAAARCPTTGKRSHVQFGLGIHGNPQGIVPCVRGVILPVDMGENRLSFTNPLDRFSLLHASQTVSEAVEDMMWLYSSGHTET
jgi:hypothetical protein